MHSYTRIISHLNLTVCRTDHTLLRALLETDQQALRLGSRFSLPKPHAGLGVARRPSCSTTKKSHLNRNRTSAARKTNFCPRHAGVGESNFPSPTTSPTSLQTGPRPGADPSQVFSMAHKRIHTARRLPLAPYLLHAGIGRVRVHEPASVLRQHLATPFERRRAVDMHRRCCAFGIQMRSQSVNHFHTLVKALQGCMISIVSELGIAYVRYLGAVCTTVRFEL